MDKTPPITRGRKFSQVLEGARRVFLRDGFEGASVDDIATEAGVSKATLYSYFPDKRLMFIEVFRAEIDRERSEGAQILDVDLPVAEVLPVIVRMIANHLVSDFGVRIYRLAVAEAERFPSLAREYYSATAEQIRNHLTGFFQRRIAAGELMINDVDLAADQLLQLAGATLHDKIMFLGPSNVDDDMISRVCDGAVQTFMAAYCHHTVTKQATTAA